MNVACDYEAPMQMLTTEKYIAARRLGSLIWFGHPDVGLWNGRSLVMKIWVKFLFLVLCKI